jgi:N-acetylmuramoyl-L-alanine amidase
VDIRNHRIDDIWYRQSTNIGGRITPKLVVTHYTTGWSGAGSRDWLLGAAGNTANSGSSAHVVIDRDGSAWQIAPFDRRAWHAGPSRHGNLTDLNTHSVGLEFVNPGWLRADGSGGWADYHGVRKTTRELGSYGGFLEAAQPRIGSGTYAWPLYPAAQIATGLQIVRALAAKYPIRAVVTHEEVDTRGWKTDPGPAFPQQAFAELLDGRGGAAPAARYLVGAVRLNLRGGPGQHYDRIDPPGHLPGGTEVTVIKREGNWSYVEVTRPGAQPEKVKPGLRGWVHHSYLELQLDE